ncbi:MAG: hypothetical protein J1E62_11085 [Lachnospiraceae bacterium]|nr:hypothetical protein [Lachnospiraceae bacterium]
MELSLQLSKQHSFTLVQDFTEYSRKKEKLKIYPDEGSTKITFRNCDRGIHWRITPKGNYSDSTDILYVKINPKILGGDIDYITAATYYDMSVAIPNFDCISKEISPILQTFNCYTLSRIDYCINFCIDELVPHCTPQQIMNLIKRSNIPSNYEEWKKYDSVAHRTKDVKSSFYLMNRAADINAYLKYDELLDRIQKGYPPIPEQMLEDSKSIIRFEVQCKRRKKYDIIEHLGIKDNGEINKYRHLLQPQVCEEVISRYFSETVGCGDWYSFAKSVEKIDSYNFNIQKRNRLVEALRIVSSCRSVHKAKESRSKDDVDSFTRTLKELSALGINPVTIPQTWGIKQIPNLLAEYNFREYDIDKLNIFD